MKCWICRENEATSREHRIKRSDIDLHAGPVSPEAPLFRRPEGARPLRVSSSRAKALAYDKILCSPCNNQRTQPHDKAWELLSRYFFEHATALSNARRVWLANVFPSSAAAAAIGVHLFFLKVFGCKCIDAGLAVDLTAIGDCIKKGTPHPRFFLAFGIMPAFEGTERFALETEISAFQNSATGYVAGAITFYVVGRLAVEMFYVPHFVHPGQPGLWDASSGSLVLRLRDYPGVAGMGEAVAKDAQLCVQADR